MPKTLIFIPYFDVCVRVHGHEVIPVPGAFEALEAIVRQCGPENVYIFGASDNEQNESLFMRSVAQHDFLGSTGVLKSNLLSMKTDLEDDSMALYVAWNLDECSVCIFYSRLQPLIDLPMNPKLLRVLTCPDSDEIVRFHEFKSGPDHMSIQSFNLRPHVLCVANWEKVAAWMKIMKLVTSS